MSEETAEQKVRKPRRDKGVKRGPRIRFVPPPQGDSPHDGAPIHVRVLLKGHAEAIEFGCANRSVENGFHVFIYPSERDRYRETRREFAISEIVEIEITAARPVLDMRPFQPQPETEVFDLRPQVSAPAPGKPHIYSPRKNARTGPSGDIVTRLATSDGPIKIGAGELGGALGVGAAVGDLGDSVA